MRTPRLVAAAGAAVLLPVVALSAPAAHADQRFTGTVTETDSVGQFYEPDTVTDTCGPETSPSTALYDSVAFVSESTGPRRFVMRLKTPDLPPAAALFVYRNGTCVAGDYQPDDETEAMDRLIDVDGVVIAKGDRVEVRLVSFVVGLAWQLDIEQPGTANAAAKGKAKKYVSLPYQIKCGPKTTKVKITKKASKARSITFTAGGKKVGSVTKVKPGSTVKLTKIPRSATKIKAVVKLKGGGKATVTRAYSSC